MIDKYKQAFQEEARELLAELESALLELDQKRDDREVVGRAFRALHTIKGSGAMFGFDDIAGFAHNLETAFDRLRNGQLAVTASLINLTLAAGDQIKAMLDAAAGRGAVDQSRSAGILAELRQLTGSPDPRPDLAPLSAADPGVPDGAPACDWHIRLRPGPDLLLNGTNPLLLLRELRALGQLRIQVDTSAIPTLSEIDAERCYLAWDMVLTTAAASEAIRDIFIFVEDDCELSIERALDQAAETPAPVILAARQSVPDARGAAGSGTASSIRVSADKLDQLVNLVGELVTVQARLSEVAGRRDDADILDISEAVDRLTAALRENSMSIRMLPLKSTFERFRRLVHDLGIELHKEVELTIEGADTELDKTVIDQLNDPLVHLIRNSMDHGIETPEARRAAGKRSTARIHISAQHSGANVLIRVSDDGRGLDVDAVRARAIEQGLIDGAARLSEAEIFSLILAPGFSTAREVTAVSGRGVGMDVVRRSMEGLRGSIDIGSKPGAGLTVTLRLPLTLAIIDGLLVRVGQAHFVLPLANSLECVELTRRDIQDAHGKHIANVRGELIPYIRLSEYFRMDTARPEREQIMVVETDHGHYGFVVDQVLGDHQTVIKNLGRLYRNVQVVSGATILGNGTVALILDPHRLVQHVIQSMSQKSAPLAGGRGTTAVGNIPGKQTYSFKKENRIDGT
ncbi:MAG: chemotaxis protein CheA [Bryobacteraceae bacterium]|jgi:two-component system chemotaxis sensor kinase CheA